MDGFIFAASAVVPVFLLIAIGVAVRAAKILDDQAVGRLSKLAFVVAMPALVFLVIVEAKSDETWNGRALLAFLGAVGLALLVGLLVARLLGMKAVRTGTFVVGCHRSNLVIVGLAVLESAYGKNWLAPAGMLAAAAVLTYNVLAVIILTLPHHSGFGWRNVLRLFSRLSTNPLILGALAGICWKLISGHYGVGIHKTIALPLEWLRRMCLPLALIAVGASLRPQTLRQGLSHVAMAAVVKLVIEPAAALLFLRVMGVGPMYCAAVVVCLSAPTAIATYTMVRSMHGDEQLASQTVTATTGLSIFSMAGWLLALKAMGISPAA